MDFKIKHLNHYHLKCHPTNVDDRSWNVNWLIVFAHFMYVYWGPVHKALVRNWVKTIPKCLWSRACSQVLTVRQESLDGGWHWRINGAKSRVKVLMARLLLLIYQDKPWGRGTRITLPDSEGLTKSYWNSVDYMSHASRFQISLFSQCAETILLYITIVMRSQG